jgi:hypothetical protein
VAALLAVAAVLVLVAGGAFGRGVDPSPSPSAPSTPGTPSTPQPSVQPSAPSTPKPTEAPSDGPVKVDLDNETEHDVSVVIDDETGSLVGAVSGQPGDGMSVRWFDSIVENLDAKTLRVVWVGLPRDEELNLSITGKPGAYQLRLVQDAPPANSDAVGFDRILVLSFDTPVSAADIEMSIED